MPIQGRGDTPYLMVDFPDKEAFDKLYSRVHGNNKDKYWDILTKLSAGATMQDAGKPYALTRERVRQIEAKFIRLWGERYWKDIEANLNITQHFGQKTFSMLEMHETNQPVGGNR